jgi:hypothetical protein
MHFFKREYNLELRAVDRKNNSLYGIIRMQAKRELLRFRGMCQFFELNKNDGSLFLDKDNLFFFGTYSDLCENYWKTPHHLTPIFKQKTSENEPFGYCSNGDNAIPLYCSISQKIMNRNEKNSAFLEDFIKMIETKSTAIFSKIVNLELDSSNKHKITGFNQYFKNFPSQLKEDAITNGSFYRFKRYGRENVTNFLPLKINDGPLGIFPDWVIKQFETK